MKAQVPVIWKSQNIILVFQNINCDCYMIIWKEVTVACFRIKIINAILCNNLSNTYILLDISTAFTLHSQIYRNAKCLISLMGFADNFMAARPHKINGQWCIALHKYFLVEIKPNTTVVFFKYQHLKSASLELIISRKFETAPKISIRASTFLMMQNRDPIFLNIDTSTQTPTHFNFHSCVMNQQFWLFIYVEIQFLPFLPKKRANMLLFF